MKLPARAWLQFEVEPRDGGSRLTQTAISDPKGLLGLSYWYGILPLHALVFRGMLDGLVRAAACGPGRRPHRRPPRSAVVVPLPRLRAWG
jgi:hypothetical protein